MALALDIATWLCFGAGGLCCLIGAVGMLRMPDVYTRMHAASIIDSAGAFLVILGMILQAGLTLLTLKLIAIFVFILLIGPAVTHALAKAAIVRGVAPVLADKEDAPSNR